MAADGSGSSTTTSPLIGIGYRGALHDWIVKHLHRFDVLEVVVDHYLSGGPVFRRGIQSLIGKIPMTAHGIGLSLGTDEPLDLAYVREVAEIVEILGATNYSEHVAFTRCGGIELANLLPLPRTRDTVDFLVDRVRTVQRHLSVPFSLENITYMFDFRNAELSDAAFLTEICRRTGATLLLDVQNVHVNSLNHDFDPVAFLAELPLGIVAAAHLAGGMTFEHVEVDTHSFPVSDGALELYRRMLACQSPATVILERDGRLDRPEELLVDVARIRQATAAKNNEYHRDRLIPT